jgi:hypothetical protein
MALTFPQLADSRDETAPSRLKQKSSNVWQNCLLSIQLRHYNCTPSQHSTSTLHLDLYAFKSLCILHFDRNNHDHHKQLQEPNTWWW